RPPALFVLSRRHEDVLALAGRCLDASLDLTLRLLLRSWIGIVALGGGEDGVLFRPVDPIAVRVDEAEVWHVGGAGVDLRVTWCAVLAIDVAVTVGVERRRRG